MHTQKLRLCTRVGCTKAAATARYRNISEIKVILGMVKVLIFSDRSFGSELLYNDAELSNIILFFIDNLLIKIVISN